MKQNKNIVRLNESQLKHIITESIKTLLTEDQTSSSINAAKKLVMQRLRVFKRTI